MNPARPLTILLVVLGGLMMMVPLLGTVFGLGATYLMADIERTADGKPSNGAIGWFTWGIGKYINHELKVEKADLFDTATISQSHLVRISQTVPLAAMLPPGTPLPAADLRDLYAEARAVTYARPLCADLLASFADRCAVIKTTTKALGDDRYALDVDIGYGLTDAARPRDGWSGLGDPGESLATGRASRELAPRSVAASEAGTVRQALMAEAAKECGKVRDLHGNCVITRLDITETPAADGTLKASAEVFMRFTEAKALPQIAAP